MDESEYAQLATLARAAGDGDVGAYGRIVELTRAAVESTARLVVHDPDDAEDVAQETYLRAFHKIAELKDTRSLVAWLQRSARNLALNRLRENRWSFVSDCEVTDIVAPAPDHDPRQTALARAMTQLTLDDRRLCKRYYSRRVADCATGGRGSDRRSRDSQASSAHPRSFEKGDVDGQDRSAAAHRRAPVETQSDGTAGKPGGRDLGGISTSV
jgi:RNA polymerase sigma factor (sigma-70 family)